MPGVRVTDERVIAAAEEALRKHGSQGLTAERVAELAGISRVTLHRRGWTRNSLLEALAGVAESRYRERLWPILTGPGTGFERLSESMGALCELAEESLNLLLALTADMNASIFHEDSDTEALTRTPFTEPLERLLTDGIADRSVRRVDPVETATVLFNMVGWTYIHLRSGHGWSPERARRATLEPVLAGLQGS